MFSGVEVSKYAGVAVVLIASGFGFPIPEELPIIGAGVLVGHDYQDAVHDVAAGAVGGGPAVHLTRELDPATGLARWWVMLPVCIAAVVVGDTVLYTVGRFGGTRLLENGWVKRRLLTPDRQANITENFHKNGILILLGARLTPGIRSPVFLMAGVLKMPFRRFIFADALYAVPGVSILFGLSFWFTDQFVEAFNKVEQYRPLVVTVVLAAVAGVVLYKVFTSRKVSTGDLSQIPDLAKPVAAVTNAVEKVAEKTVERAGHATASMVDKVRHHHPRRIPEGPLPPPAVELPVVPAVPVPADAPADSAQL